MKVEIEIVSKAVGDMYYRYHGKTIDKELSSNFWRTQREAVIGIAARSFRHTQKVELDPGRHYVVYGISTSVGYWDATIRANGVVIGEGRIRRGQWLKAEFLVTPFPPYIIPIKPPGPPFESPTSTLNNILAFFTAPFRR